MTLLRQELAAALEHAGDERDTLLTEAATASELRRRLAQATAERDTLSDQNAHLQREAQQLTAAGDVNPYAGTLRALAAMRSTSKVEQMHAAPWCLSSST
jgi:hypothetical protein